MASTMMRAPAMQQISTRSVGRPSVSSTFSPARPLGLSRSALRVQAKRHAGEDDSYQKIEAPVRGGEGKPGNIPDFGPPISERQNELDREIVSSDGNREREILGSEVSIADSFRFKGALPEIANCRLAMLGFVAAVAAELRTGAPVSEQFAKSPGPIAGVFLLFIVATLIPILRGVPRKGGAEWSFGLPQFTPNAELVIGRTAMLGFAGLVLTEAIKGSAVF
jgi:hypothetical protein